MGIVAAQTSFIKGKGHPDFDLAPAELRDILYEALSTISPGSSVLAIVADKTRDDNTDVLFPLATQILEGRKLSRLDALVAQGTHAPMSERDKRSKIEAIGATQVPGLGHIFDHDWADPEITGDDRRFERCERQGDYRRLNRSVDRLESQSTAKPRVLRYYSDLRYNCST